jgi:hypothetical protein
MNGREIRMRLGGAIGRAFRAPVKTAQRREAGIGTSPQQIVDAIAAKRPSAAGGSHAARPAAGLEVVAISVRPMDGDRHPRFSDRRSLRQIAIYVAYRMRGCDERNERALARWNRYLREQWELDHLGAPADAPRARTGEPRAV